MICFTPAKGGTVNFSSVFVIESNLKGLPLLVVMTPASVRLPANPFPVATKGPPLCEMVILAKGLNVQAIVKVSELEKPVAPRAFTTYDPAEIEGKLKEMLLAVDVIGTSMLPKNNLGVSPRPAVTQVCEVPGVITLEEGNVTEGVALSTN